MHRVPGDFATWPGRWRLPWPETPCPGTRDLRRPGSLAGKGQRPGDAAIGVLSDFTPAIERVSMSDANAAEAGLDPGAFLLTRNGGPLASPLGVSVVIGGTAIANRDYQVLSGVTRSGGNLAGALTVSFTHSGRGRSITRA